MKIKTIAILLTFLISSAAVDAQRAVPARRAVPWDMNKVDRGRLIGYKMLSRVGGGFHKPFSVEELKDLAYYRAWKRQQDQRLQQRLPHVR